jgi:hypothetical protein
VADGTSFGRDINTMIYENGATFYSYGIGSPGNYFSGTGVANTSIGAQGYRYVGGGVYMDVATGHAVDYSTVHNNYILPNAAQLPANTIINSIEIGEKGVWFQYGGNQIPYTKRLTDPGAINPIYKGSGGEVIGKFINWRDFNYSGMKMTPSDKANTFLFTIQSPFSLMEAVNSIRGGDIAMVKAMGNISSTIGGISLVYNAYYYYSSDKKFSIGDAARLLSNAAYFIPYAGIVYGVVDIGYGIDGYSVTDRFGDWIDYHLGDYHDVDPRFFKLNRP